MTLTPIRLAFSCLIGLFLLSGQPASSGAVDVPAQDTVEAWMRY